MLTPSQIQEQLDELGIRPSRALGQNFVADPNIVRKIARLAQVEPGTPVLEIGAGLGSLTLALAEAGADVTAVEIDRHVLPILRRNVEPLGAQVVEADAMTVEWLPLLAAHDEWVLVANLPYNIATPLVLDLLRDVPQIRRMLVMVQLEVGERLAAGPGSKAYGIPSVLVANQAHATIVGKVPASVFIPPPKIESALVRVERRVSPVVPPDASHRFELLVRTAFGQRRKMLRNSLGDLVPTAAFDAAAIRPDTRPEQLDVTDWARLTAALTPP